MYKVVSPFYDSENKEFLYEVGDKYPTNGTKPTKARIEVLMGKNEYNRVFIIEAEEEKVVEEKTE